MKIKFTNPIYYELKKNNLITDKNLKKISNKTRDSKIPVFQDKVSKIILLKDFKRNKEYYKNKKRSEKIYFNKKRLLQKKTFTKINKKKISTKNLDDDLRRYLQFQISTKNKKILDFGCGWGGFLNNIKNSKKLYGLEVRDDCFHFIKKKMKIIKIFNNFNQINEKFDLITMFHVLEHIPEQVKLLKKLKEKLNNNGKIILEVPHAKDFLINLEELKEFKDFTFWSEHLILHTEESIKKLLTISGFKNIKISYFQRYGFDNHLYWFIKKKPGGHEYFDMYSNKEIDYIYKNYLQRNKISDTIIVEAKV